MNVINLFIKRAPGEPMHECVRLSFDQNGLAGQTTGAPLRQILLLSTQTLSKFPLAPGQLRENILLSGEDISELPSGTVLQLGSGRVRLTFHCEPCVKIKHLVSLKAVAHKRGYFAQCIEQGTVRLGDAVRVLPERMGAIPYEFADRLEWYLSGLSAPQSSLEVLRNIGLSAAYARALPGKLCKLPTWCQSMVVFKSSAIADR